MPKRKKSILSKRQKLIQSIDWQNIPDRIFVGAKRLDVSIRLREYIKYLKEDGLSMSQAAAKAGIAYLTIQTQRERNKEFALYEELALECAVGEVSNTLFQNATTKNSKLQVSASNLWLKFNKGWSEPKQEIRLTEDGIGYDFSRWSKGDLKVAEKFLELLEKYENEYE